MQTDWLMVSRFERNFIANIVETIDIKNNYRKQFDHMYVFIIRAPQQHIVYVHTLKIHIF